MILAALLLLGCGGGDDADTSVRDGGLADADAGSRDGGRLDAMVFDGGFADGGLPDGGGADGGFADGGGADGGFADGGLADGGLADGGLADGGATDGGLADGGVADAGHDGGPPDAGHDGGPPDAGHDSGPPDAGHDSGPPDAGPPSGGCISGATGTHALRFRWLGSGSGSTAYVRYDTNTLPDTSRWRVSAASMSIGYTPVFVDPFLGEGGLQLSGTVFIDVELSTMGLSAIRNVTIAVYGRSYSTGSSGSFTWQTFSGTGGTPSGTVANSAPYEWYEGDATAVFVPGDDGVLLRLRAGPPSSALVVAAVEVCFDAS